jgi:VanZ family protein
MSSGEQTKMKLDVDGPAPPGVERCAGNFAQALVRDKRFAWACVFVWMAVIFAFSAQAHSGEITAEYLGDYNVSVRKCAHMCEYAFLFFLCRRAFLLTAPGFHGTSGLWPLALSFFYAMTDEFHQLFVPGRSAQFNDVLIDTAGATIAWLLLSCIAFIRARRRA